jgi:hypothetical protein
MLSRGCPPNWLDLLRFENPAGPRDTDSRARRFALDISESLISTIGGYSTFTYSTSLITDDSMLRGAFVI